MKAQYLLKHNIDTLLTARGQKRKDLAQWCRRPESWLSQIMKDDGKNGAATPREFQMKYLDRIADFYGIATYQLFQPGISSLTERRGGRERRTFRDRRISHAQEGMRPPRTPDLETVTPWERAHLARVRRLEAEDRKHMEYLIDRALLAIDAAPKTEVLSDQTGNTAPPVEPIPHIRKRRKAK